jgi:hypothetical protein
MRIPSHIPGLCATSAAAAFRTETNSSDIGAVCGVRVSFADFGGTAVSCSEAEFPVREWDTKRESVIEWQALTVLPQSDTATLPIESIWTSVFVRDRSFRIGACC